MNALLFSILFFLGTALLFYVLFAGADFGAGILELFMGKQRRKEQQELISHAMAPVWEANHVWLILAVVILFVAFPMVYAIVSTYLYLPIMAILMGIVARGTAFTFRYYDPLSSGYYRLYSKVFALASLWTSFFLGIAAGAWALGHIDPSAHSYYDLYLACWLNPFCFMMGAFTSSLFAFLAAVYLTGETNDVELKDMFRKRAAVLNVLIVFFGAMVFMFAQAQGVPLFKDFFSQPLSLACFILATVLLLPFWKNLIKKESAFWERIMGATMVALVLLGWYVFQYPAIIRIRQGGITFAQVAAPDATLRALLWALSVGGFLIFPTLIYLLKIFKREKLKS